MSPNDFGTRNAPRLISTAGRGIWGRLRKRSLPARALLTVIGLGIACAVPGVAFAQNCKLHYAEAFQMISTQSFEGQSAATIRQWVDDLFGPRQEVCGENGYKFFLTQLGAQAADAMHKKGSEQEVRLLVTREILNRFPLQVRFSTGVDPAAGLNQLRSDLGVISTEVGVTPSIKTLLEVLAKIAPPRNRPKPLPKNDDAIPITVPRVPLPAWAVISLYEIRDHATRKDHEAIAAKTNQILAWIARASPGVRLAEPASLGPAPTK